MNKYEEFNHKINKNKFVKMINKKTKIMNWKKILQNNPVSFKSFYRCCTERDAFVQII